MARLPAIYKGIDKVRSRYGKAFVATWREAKKKSANPDDIPFTKTDIVRHSEKIKKLGITAVSEASVKNFPDALYSFRARADLPREILGEGDWAIVGRGKGKYAFVRIERPNRFAVPSGIPTKTFSHSIPAWVIPHLGSDEQSTLTVVGNSTVLTTYLGLESVFLLQSHLRMGVRNYGQVEVDSLYVGLDSGDQHIGIAVEAKNREPGDLLNVSQLFGTARALVQLFPDIPKLLVGVKPGTDGSIAICRFTVADHPRDLNEADRWCRFREADVDGPLTRRLCASESPSARRRRRVVEPDESEAEV